MAISEQEWNDPAVQQIVNEMALNSAFINDIFSLEKEIRHNGGDIRVVANKNYVARTVVREGLSVREAQCKVIKQFEESEQRYYTLERKYLERGDRSDAMKAFLEGCRNIMMGTFVGCAMCRRYSGYQGGRDDPYGVYF